MILIVKKDKVAFVALFFLLSIAIYSLNTGINSSAVQTTNNLAKNKIVIVDAGHGGEDPGAVSDYNEIREKEINFNIASKVKALLEAENFKVIMTREDDTLQYRDGTKSVTQKRKQDLLRRKKIMDEAGADIVVSIHLNKFSQTQYYGAQTFYPPKSPESKKLAEYIQKSLRDTVDPDNKREAMLKNTQIIILKNLKTPTVIVECGFLSNREEEQKLASEEHQKKLAKAIKDGIMKYYEN